MKPGIGLSPSRDRLSMETIFTFGYNLPMQFLVRIIAVAVLAAFVAGSLAHAAGAAEMAVTMVSSSDAAMGMSDCETCADPDADNALQQKNHPNRSSDLTLRPLHRSRITCL